LVERDSILPNVDVFVFAKPIEGKILCIAAPPHPLKESNSAQQYKDWNDSGGQRPALIQVKSKKEKIKRNARDINERHILREK